MYLFLNFTRKIHQRNYNVHWKKSVGYFVREKNNESSADKGILINKLADAYQPHKVEAEKWQTIGELKDWTDDHSKDDTFNMLLPPPNVTGNLHLGHALMATVQDVICRSKHKMGYKIDWVPGMDHAGIATQVVVEKKLLKELGLSRQQLGRDRFLQEVWKWKEQKAESITDDLKKLGCGLNWKKQYFTMDERQAHAVNTAFIQLFDEGLIKRRKSLVNWSCALESAISDMEVETLQLTGPTEVAVPGHATNAVFGKMYDIKYSVLDTNEQIVVSTTRPETMLGDVAVAVHPYDERYTKYRQLPEVLLWHPFRKTTIPLVFDLAVDPEFGTGAVKLTPAHDKTDFEMAVRHLLEPVQVFTQQGRITTQFEPFKDMPRFEARTHILHELAEMQLLGSIRSHAMNLPICSRSKDVVEYMLRQQWFLHTQPLADAAISEVASGRMHIDPPSYKTEWNRWLQECHDWCISRQLWWGHRIPAYLAKDASGYSCWIAAHNAEEAAQKAQKKLKSEHVFVTQDEDVLDTWFSSALLPFSAHNWPNEEYKQHYPLDLMETGHDILFFWVARMVMLGLKLTGVAPFKTVLLNGIVCDAHGRKMSKSLGNVITPQQVVQGITLEELQAEAQKNYDAGTLTAVELQKSAQGLKKMFPQGIPACGTDALRFTLCSHYIKSRFINFDVAECHTNKLFLNKIWQATRFTLGSAARLNIALKDIETLNNVRLSKWDAWIMHRLVDTMRVYTSSFDEYELQTVTAALKQFFYSNFCDTYLETTKLEINAGTSKGYIHCAILASCLSWGLQLLAPFTPFIVEELMQHLPRSVDMRVKSFYDPELAAEIEHILFITQKIRQLKSQHQISKKHEPEVYIMAENTEAFKMLHSHVKEMQALVLMPSIQVKEKPLQAEDVKFDFFSTAGHLCSFGINVNKLHKDIPANANDFNAQKLAKLQEELEHYRLRVNNEGFKKGASAEVQLKHHEKIKQLEIEITSMKTMAN